MSARAPRWHAQFDSRRPRRAIDGTGNQSSQSTQVIIEPIRQNGPISAGVSGLRSAEAFSQHRVLFFTDHGEHPVTLS
jgi:hypothetical protein